MLFDTFVETDKRQLVGCTFHVSTDKKNNNKKEIKKKNSHQFYCCFRKLSDGFHLSFRYYVYGGCSMEISDLKIPFFLDFVKSRKNCLYLKERKAKKSNEQVKKVQCS